MSTHLPYGKTYECTLKTRQEMEKAIPAQMLGWWHTCIPGRTVDLRQATKQDMDRCWVRFGASKAAEHYMVELHEKGCLILKTAIKTFKEKL